MTNELFVDLFEQLEARGLKLAIAESITGGLLSSNFVSVPGASKVLLGSVVAYQDSVKHKLLSVSNELLESKGAVSSEVAEAMASGVRSLLTESGTDIGKVVTIATTGMASDDPYKPGGPPAGLVYVAVQLPSRTAEVLKLSLLGSRNEIRQEAARRAALLLQSLLNRD